MHIAVDPAAFQEKIILRHLLELYRYEFSAFDGEDVDDVGLFGYRYLDHYWTEPDRLPFLIRVDGRLAGFALLWLPADPGGGAAPNDIAEFFVLRKYRRLGVGRAVAVRLFGRFPGTWQVRELAENTAAQTFWRAVIGAYAGSRYTEIARRDDDWEGPVQSCASPPA
jgi:predicted acetyltransferase